MATTPASVSLDDLPDGVVVLTWEGTVRSVNAAAARLFGVCPDALVDRPLGEVLPLRDDAGRDWWACTAPLRAWRSVRGLSERELHLDGGAPLLVTASYVREGEKLARVVLTLRSAAARERAERGRAELVSTVAHELRSPLTSVKGFTATLLAKWERFTDEQKKVMLTTVNADADRVTRLLTELLDVSRIDTGRVELHRQVVDLATTVRRAFDGQIAAGESAERFQLEVEGSLPEMWLDRDKLDQVVGNLVENALRHGSGAINVRIVGQPAGAILSVADQGEGVPEELRNRVFTKFFRGRVRRGGTGLGLYIVKGLVGAHNGT
ncbi:MAG: sensor histidine kinase, partial [Mycobacteriales bacterium]